MTKEEIKALVAQKIAGQGMMVDAGGGLPTILDAIIDLIPEVPAPYVLPIASADTLGGVKVGNNLSIDEDGKLSAQGGALPILNVTTFHQGDVTTLEQFYTKIKLNGENITSLDDIIALKGKSFIITEQDEQQYYVSYTYITQGYIVIVAGVVIPDEIQAQIYIDINTNDISLSAISIFEV